MAFNLNFRESCPLCVFLFWFSYLCRGAIYGDKLLENILTNISTLSLSTQTWPQNKDDQTIITKHVELSTKSWSNTEILQAVETCLKGSLVFRFYIVPSISRISLTALFLKIKHLKELNESTVNNLRFNQTGLHEIFWTKIFLKTTCLAWEAPAL